MAASVSAESDRGAILPCGVRADLGQWSWSRFGRESAQWLGPVQWVRGWRGASSIGPASNIRTTTSTPVSMSGETGRRCGLRPHGNHDGSGQREVKRERSQECSAERGSIGVIDPHHPWAISFGIRGGKVKSAGNACELPGFTRLASVRSFATFSRDTTYNCVSATSMARSRLIALLTVSSYSLAATLSATTPAPAWT